VARAPRIFGICCALSLPTLACAHERTGPSQSARSPVAPAEASKTEPVASKPENLDTCPATDADTRVIAEEHDRGSALVFTTRDNTRELRRRVRSLEFPTEIVGEPNPDKIRKGIRLVFATDDPNGVERIQRTIGRYAEDIADRCGLVLAPPKSPPTPRPERAEAPKRATPVPSVQVTTEKKKPPTKPAPVVAPATPPKKAAPAPAKPAKPTQPQKPTPLVPPAPPPPRLPRLPADPIA
jgi:hypothetical protein